MMKIAVLQFELLIPGAESLKDKRRVVRSVKDRLHREHQASVAEVEHLDNPAVAGMALVMVNRDGKYLQATIDRILQKLRSLGVAELGACYHETLEGEQLPTEWKTEEGEELWRDEERRTTTA